MRISFLAMLLICLSTGLNAQLGDSTKHGTISKNFKVEASCGQCKFGLPGKGCNLAVRFNGKAYFVDGSDIDSHGDAHAEDGFCNAIRKAEVQGKVVNNRFKATYFHLLPDTLPAKEKPKA